MEDEILFSGAGGSAYVKVSARTGSAGNVGGTPGGKGKVAPPKVRKRVQPPPKDSPEAPRQRRSAVEARGSDTPGNEGAEQRSGNWRRTTSGRGLAGRTGRRLRRPE